MTVAAADRVSIEKAREFPRVLIVAETGRSFQFGACGAFADEPRMCEYSGWGSLRMSTAELDAGLASGALVDATPPMPPCLDAHPDDPCAGKVEYRFSGGSSMKAWPRCEKHGAERLERSRAASSYESDIAPAWFDEADAGERWDDEY